MNDKNIEEKAKEYAKDCSLCPTLESQEEIDISHKEEIERAYINAYTQAVTDQHSKMTFLELELDIKNQDNAALLKQLTQYKAALSVFIGFLELLNFKEAKVEPEGAANDLFDTLTDAISKAKQLLNKE